MHVTIAVCQTAWGWIGTAFSAAGLLGSTLPVASIDVVRTRLKQQWPDAEEAITAPGAALHDLLRRYLAGESVDLCAWPLDTGAATEFQRRAWHAARGIPRGQVLSYGALAARLGNVRGARAVGRAMALNPFPLVVPCHRVVGKDCDLTGFAGGLAMKRRLLALEGWPCLDDNGVGV